MADKEIIIQNFIRNFVLKHKRERAFLELTNPRRRSDFTDKLNHHWENVLDMRFLKQIEKQQDHADAIQQLLKFRNDEPCYVISNDEEYDDHILPFRDVFHEVYTRGFATVLLNVSADTLFLDTEPVRGGTPRFIGRRQITVY